MATQIAVYNRKNRDNFVTEVGTVLVETHGDFLVFESELALLEAAGNGYYVMTAKPDETGLAQFRDLEVSHSGRGAVISYKCKLGRAWSGYVGASPTEEKKAHGETKETP